MTKRQVFRAADLIARATRESVTNPMLLAEALESAQLLQSPETAAESAHYRSAFEAQQARAETLDGLLRTAQDRIAELERQRNAFRDQRNNVFATNEQLLAEVQESDQARLLAENETRTVKREFAEAAATVARLVQERGERMKVENALRDEGEELRGRVAELEAAPTTVYRAEHPDSGITLGHYGTATAARAHCEATERRAWPTGTNLAFDWIEDDEDRVAELVVTAGQNEESTTGYIVTALELDSEYDPDGDE